MSTSRPSRPASAPPPASSRGQGHAPDSAPSAPPATTDVTTPADETDRATADTSGDATGRAATAASTSVKTDLTSPSQPGEANMPHERDETVGMTGGETDPVIRQGQRDVERGLKDTSRANETDAAYHKLRK